MCERVIALVVGVLAAAIFAAGYGSGEGDGASTGATAAENSSIAKAEFIKKADAICAAVKKKMVSEIQETLRTSNTQNALEGGLSVILTTDLQARVDEIRALGVPTEGSNQVDAILDAMQEQVEEAKASPQKIAEGTNLEADRLARAYGIKACGLVWL